MKHFSFTLTLVLSALGASCERRLPKHGPSASNPTPASALGGKATPAPSPKALVMAKPTTGVAAVEEATTKATESRKLLPNPNGSPASVTADRLLEILGALAEEPPQTKRPISGQKASTSKHESKS